MAQQNLTKSLFAFPYEVTSDLTQSKMMKFQAENTTFGNSFFLNESTVSKNPMKIRRSDLEGLPFAVSAHEISGLLDRTTYTSKLTDSDFSNIDELYQEAIQAYGTTQMVYDAILNFVEICNNEIQFKYNATRNFGPEKELASLENERNTWRLIHALFKDREANQNNDVDGESNIISSISEKKIVEHLYKTNTNVRECQIVVDWLERLSYDDWNVLNNPHVAHFTDKTVAWENTLHQLQNSSVAFKSSREIVASLDPDAPYREHKSLHDLDRDDEQRLLSQVFREVRMGRLDKAEELCLHCGQAWRAAALEGWRLYHIPRNNSGTTSVPAEGNPHRSIWKWNAWSICEDNTIEPLYRAVIGALCGHIDSLRPLCKSWEDALWAHSRVSIDVRVEQQIKENSLRDNFIPLSDKYWNSYLSLEEIFNKLKATDELKSEANSPRRLIQELICLDKHAELITKMACWIENHDCDKSTKRFLAHIILVLRLLGRGHPEDQANEILKAYVEVLMEEGKPYLVAYYVSMLKEADQIEEYATFLEPISALEKKIECLEAAEKCELCIPLITKRAVELIWNNANQHPEDDYLSKETSETDLKKINALDWMTFYPEQRADAIQSANTVIRSLIGQGRLEAARLAYNKIPPNFVDQIMAQYNCILDSNNCLQTDNLPPKINSALKEYLCYKAYLDCEEGFSAWFRMYHSKPTRSKDDSAGEFGTQRENMKLFNEQFESWKVTISHVTKTVRAQLYNVLLFPGSGWLSGVAHEDSPQHQTQLEALRSLCIPQTVFLLHTILHGMELYEECFDLVTVVMSEKHQIYKVFSKQGLKDFLDKIADSAVLLSDSAADDFGLPPSEETYRPLVID